MTIDSNHLTPGSIRSHYEAVWSAAKIAPLSEDRGPAWQLPVGFHILEIAPHGNRSMWTYATCGMSAQGASPPLELHLFSATQFPGHVELLTAVAHYHLTEEYLGLGHTVNFGRPWMPGSHCEFGFISLPYLDGPGLEWLNIGEKQVRFLWLIPITDAERAYKIKHGIEALETKFDEAQFNYLDPQRVSVL